MAQVASDWLARAAEATASAPGLLQEGEPIEPADFDDWPRELLPSVEAVVVSVVAGVVVYALGRYLLVPATVRVVRRRNERNPTVVQAIDRYTRLLVLVVAVAVGVVAAGFGHVLAGSSLVIAAATLAIGVAGQDVLGNLVSGLFLVSDPEFNVDDWIEWEDGEGVVEAIRFRVTRVRTADGEVVTVPNTRLATTPVWRPYSRDRYRIVVRVGIAHEEDAEHARAVVRRSVDVGEEHLTQPDAEVLVEDVGEDALWLRAEFWIAQPSRADVRRVRSRYVLHLQQQLKDEGVAFSPPPEHVLSGSVEIA